MGRSKHLNSVSPERRQEIGRRIYEARRALGLTQTALAHRIGSFYSTISRYEAGARIPDYRIMPRLAEALGVTAEYLLATEVDHSSPASAPVPAPLELTGLLSGKEIRLTVTIKLAD